MSKKMDKLFYSSEKNNNLKGYNAIKKLFYISFLAMLFNSNFATDDNLNNFNFDPKHGYSLKNQLQSNNKENDNLTFYIKYSYCPKLNISIKKEDILRNKKEIYEEYKIKKRKITKNKERRNSKEIKTNKIPLKSLSRIKSENILNVNEIKINIKNIKKNVWNFSFLKTDESNYEIEIYGISNNKEIKLYSSVFSPKFLIKKIQKDKNDKIDNLAERTKKLINLLGKENTTTVNRLKGLISELNKKEAREAFFDNYEALENEINAWYLICDDKITTEEKNSLQSTNQNFDIIKPITKYDTLNKIEKFNIRKSFKIDKIENLNKQKNLDKKTENKNNSLGKKRNSNIETLLKIRRKSRLSNGNNILRRKTINNGKKSLKQFHLIKNYLTEDKNEINIDRNYNKFVENISSLNNKIINGTNLVNKNIDVKDDKNQITETISDINNEQKEKLQDVIVDKISEFTNSKDELNEGKILSDEYDAKSKNDEKEESISNSNNHKDDQKLINISSIEDDINSNNIKSDDTSSKDDNNKDIFHKKNSRKSKIKFNESFLKYEDIYKNVNLNELPTKEDYIIDNVKSITSPKKDSIENNININELFTNNNTKNDTKPNIVHKENNVKNNINLNDILCKNDILSKGDINKLNINSAVLSLNKPGKSEEQKLEMIQRESANRGCCC